MTPRLIAGLALAAAATALVAEQTTPLEGLDTKPYQDLFQVPEDQAQIKGPAAIVSNPLAPPEDGEPSRGDRCMEMARQIEALKGKPLQRSALNDRYQQECALD